MRKKLVTCFVLGIIGGLSFAMLWANFSVKPVPSVSGASSENGAEVRFVGERNAQGAMAGYLVARVDGAWQPIQVVSAGRFLPVQ